MRVVCESGVCTDGWWVMALWVSYQVITSTTFRKSIVIGTIIGRLFASEA